MLPLEFLAYGLKPGQKVVLKLNTPQRAIICYFKGLRTFMDRRVAKGIDDIIPLFCETQKDGQMGRKEVPFTDFSNIISIEPVTHSMIDLADIPGWWMATKVMDSTAYHQIEDILSEMALLFPGKRIPLHPDFHTCASYVDIHGGNSTEYPGDIISIGIDENKNISLELDSNGISDVYDEGDVHIENYSELLYDLVMSISRPPMEEYTENLNDKTTVILRSYNYKTLPSANEKEHPVLSELSIIEELRVNLWWDKLPWEEKGKLYEAQEDKFDFLMEDCLKRYSIPNNLQAVDKLNIAWSLFSHDWKKYFYQSVTKDYK